MGKNVKKWAKCKNKAIVNVTSKEQYETYISYALTFL